MSDNNARQKSKGNNFPLPPRQRRLTLKRGFNFQDENKALGNNTLSAIQTNNNNYLGIPLSPIKTNNNNVLDKNPLSAIQVNKRPDRKKLLIFKRPDGTELVIDLKNNPNYPVKITDNSGKEISNDKLSYLNYGSTYNIKFLEASNNSLVHCVGCTFEKISSVMSYGGRKSRKNRSSGRKTRKN